MCTIFVVLVGLTVALIVFTPLKYYIPGYDDLRVGREYRQLKFKTDALEKQVILQEAYIDNVRKVLRGDAAALDTTLLQLPPDEMTDE